MLTKGDMWRCHEEKLYLYTEGSWEYQDILTFDK